jgi:hypothetical protein
VEKSSTTTEAAPLFAGEAWFDPIEAELRERVRQFLGEMVEQEATAALGRGHYERGAATGYRTERASGGYLARSAWSKSKFRAPGSRRLMARPLANAQKLPLADGKNDVESKRLRR